MTIFPCNNTLDNNWATDPSDWLRDLSLELAPACYLSRPFPRIWKALHSVSDLIFFLVHCTGPGPPTACGVNRCEHKVFTLEWPWGWKFLHCSDPLSTRYTKTLPRECLALVSLDLTARFVPRSNLRGSKLLCYLPGSGSDKRKAFGFGTRQICL